VAVLLVLVEQQVRHERVGLAFPAEGRHLAVAGDELDVLAERPQALADRVDELLVVAARQVAAADGMI